MFLREGTQQRAHEGMSAPLLVAARPTSFLSSYSSSYSWRTSARRLPAVLSVQTATILAALVTVCSVGASAEEGRANVPSPSKNAIGVELPSEILPWRRDIEQAASRLLAAARSAVSLGNELEAKRQLEALEAKFPGTQAAREGRQAFADLQHRMIASRVGRHGLGNPGPVAAPAGKSVVLDPVGGWHASVRPEYADLHEELIEAAGDRVFFGNGSARLAEPTRATLKKQAQWLQARPQVMVRIIGHADDQGSDERNLSLSHDRAMVVRKQLMLYGVASRRLHVLSQGKAQPIAICSVESCAAQNRRVVIEVRPVRRAAVTVD